MSALRENYLTLSGEPINDVEDDLFMVSPQLLEMLSVYLLHTLKHVSMFDHVDLNECSDIGGIIIRK